MSRCSSVCGITPSSAATVKSTRSMPWAPASMLRMNRSCPGTSTTPARVPSGQIEVREAEVDRDAALLLFLEPVGVLSGERLDEARLAVVDVAGGADDEGHQDLCRARAAAPTGSWSSAGPGRRIEDRPQVEQESIVADAADDRRTCRAEASRRCGARPSQSCSMAMTLVGISSVGSAPLPICDVESSSDTRKSGPSAPLQRRQERAAPMSSISASGRVNALSVGMSCGDVGRLRYSRSVASSAAIVSLPHRSARCSGFRPICSIQRRACRR